MLWVGLLLAATPQVTTPAGADTGLPCAVHARFLDSLEARRVRPTEPTRASFQQQGTRWVFTLEGQVSLRRELDVPCEEAGAVAALMVERAFSSLMAKRPTVVLKPEPRPTPVPGRAPAPAPKPNESKPAEAGPLAAPADESVPREAPTRPVEATSPKEKERFPFEAPRSGSPVDATSSKEAPRSGSPVDATSLKEASRSGSPVDATSSKEAPRAGSPVDATSPKEAPRPVSPVDATSPKEAPRPVSPADATPPVDATSPRETRRPVSPLEATSPSETPKNPNAPTDASRVTPLAALGVWWEAPLRVSPALTLAVDVELRSWWRAGLSVASALPQTQLIRLDETRSGTLSVWSLTAVAGSGLGLRLDRVTLWGDVLVGLRVSRGEGSGALYQRQPVVFLLPTTGLRAELLVRLTSLVSLSATAVGLVPLGQSRFNVEGTAAAWSTPAVDVLGTVGIRLTP